MKTNLSNLSIHFEYDGTDEVVIIYKSGLPISHVDSLSFQSPNRVFHLRDTLCVPTIQKKILILLITLPKIIMSIQISPFLFFGEGLDHRGDIT